MSQNRFDFLKSDGRFAFLLDGFDELRLPDFASDRARVFFGIREFIGPQSPIVVSCRPTYFATEFELKATLKALTEPRQRFLARLYGFSQDRQTPATNLLTKINRQPALKNVSKEFRVFHIDTFDEPRIKKYIQRFIDQEHSSINSSVDEIYDYLIKIYDISDLICRPLLLYIILQMIEQDVVLIDDPRRIGGAAEIYSLYVESCISRDHDKKVGREVFTTHERRRIAQHLALFMSKFQVLRVGWPEVATHMATSAAHGDLLVSKIGRLGMDQIAADIRVCAFLRFDGDDGLRFAHKSFMEFFVAQHIFESNQEFIEITVLRASMSQEVLFFLSEFVRFNPKFRDRLPGERLLTTTDVPGPMSKVEFDTFRRNLCALLLMANAHRSLQSDGIILDSLIFSNIKMESLKIRESGIKEVSFRNCAVEQLTLDDCDIDRLELAKWEGKSVVISGSVKDLSLAHAELGLLAIVSKGGRVDVGESWLARIELGGGAASRSVLRDCKIGALAINGVTDSVEMANCTIDAIEYPPLTSAKDLLRLADSLVIRKVSGDISSITLGSLDRPLFDRIVAARAGSRGVYFLDVENWPSVLREELMFIRQSCVFVKKGAIADFERNLREANAQSAYDRASEIIDHLCRVSQQVR